MASKLQVSKKFHPTFDFRDQLMLTTDTDDMAVNIINTDNLQN